MAKPIRSSVLSAPSSRKPRQALVASARGLSKLPATNVRGRPQAETWQRMGWDFLNAVGEFRYSVNWVGNLLSKATLYVTYDGKRLDPEAEGLTAPQQRALAYHAAMFGGIEGQREMLRQIGVHFTVAGECYFLAETKGEGASLEDTWMIYSSTELTRGAGDTWTTSDTEQKFTDPLVIRMWRPHPEKPHLADAPTRAVLPVLQLIDGLTQHDYATIQSRLASAGILVLPDSVQFPSIRSRTTGEGEEEATEQVIEQNAQGLMEELGLVAATAIGNRSDPSAVVPIIIQVPEEAVDKIQHVTFFTEFDEKAPELMDRGIQRLALGMDMPPEVLTGVGESNHWAAWSVDESSIKIHADPLLVAVTGALAEGFLRPLLVEDTDEKEVMRYGFGADTSKMRLRPDRSKEAFELWDRGELSAKTLRKENGFTEEDAPEDEDKKTWLLWRLAQGSPSPEVVQAAVMRIVPDLVIADAPDDNGEGDRQGDRPPPRSLEQHQTRELPERDDSSTLAPAASMLVLRALERAGNRIRTKLQAHPPGSAVEAYLHVPVQTGDLDALLKDAWTDYVPTLAAECGVNAAQLEQSLDSYARALIMQRAKHDPALMMSYLSLTTTGA
jgi:hypothetical protein